MRNKNADYRTKTNRVYEKISRDDSGLIYVTKLRKTIGMPLAVFCSVASAFFILLLAVAGFDAAIAGFAAVFALLAAVLIGASVRMKTAVSRDGIRNDRLFKGDSFRFSDVEKFTARAVKHVMVYYSFIEIPAGTEHEFIFYLKGRKGPLKIPFVHDSRSIRFIEDCLIEKELAEMEELFRNENKTLEWQRAFIKSLRDETAVPEPQLFGLRHLLINALYICGPSSPFYTFTGPYTTLPPEHVESWIRNGYLTSVEENWYQKWYSELPADWKDKWLTCIEEYAADNALSDNFDRIRLRIRGIRSNLQ